MSPRLESGIYVIINHQTNNLVFRHPMEDKSGLPKPVYALSPGILPLGKWEVEKTPNGKYVLMALGAPTGPYKDSGDEHSHVYAFFGGEDGPVEWEITEVATTAGRRGYIIETVSDDDGGSIGWSARGESDGGRGIRIAVKPLPSTRSLPPQYFSSDVFEFTSARED